MAFVDDFADRLKERGEFVVSQALATEGARVRFDGPGKPPVTDGPFAETNDLIAAPRTSGTDPPVNCLMS